jgi:hypothetical protein
MSAANSIECIEALVGEKLVGIIEHWSHSDITSCKALVFESGRALVLGNNGSYWTASTDDVDRIVSGLTEQYERTKKNVERLLTLAGRTPAGRRAGSE